MILYVYSALRAIILCGFGALAAACKCAAKGIPEAVGDTVPDRFTAILGAWIADVTASSKLYRVGCHECSLVTSPPVAHKNAVQYGYPAHGTDTV